MVKPGQQAEGKDYVDGISGGTITSHGVDVMLMKSIGQYENFLGQVTDGGTAKRVSYNLQNQNKYCWDR